MHTQEISFAVQGMYCARCAVDLEHSLAQHDGVVGACVNYASERAMVLYYPARVKPSAFVSIVKTAGFNTPLEQVAFTQPNLAQRIWNKTHWFIPTFAGVAASAALILFYLGILSIAQSPNHALEQLAQDRFWVGLVALGFGAQIGLFVYLRMIIQAMRLVGTTAMTGAGTTTSTVGMLACCAHHLTDVAPLVTLTGASAFVPAVSFLATYKIPFIVLGLGVNAIAIVMSVRTLYKQHAHLKGREHAVQPETIPTAACHRANAKQK